MRQDSVDAKRTIGFQDSSKFGFQTENEQFMKVEIYSQQIGRLHTSSDARWEGLKARMFAEMDVQTAAARRPK